MNKRRVKVLRQAEREPEAKALHEAYVKGFKDGEQVGYKEGSQDGVNAAYDQLQPYMDNMSKANDELRREKYREQEKRVDAEAKLKMQARKGVAPRGRKR